MTQYINHVVRQGETLESIANARLGSADRWSEIALLNRLRLPFLSDDPSEQYGQVMASGVTTLAIAADALTYTLPLPVDTGIYAANTTFYLDRVELSATKFDAMVISSVAATTGVATFKPSVSLTLLEAVTAGTFTIPVTNVTNIRIGTLIKFDAETVAVTALPAIDGDPTITAVFTASHVIGTNGTYGFQNAYPSGTTFRLFPQRNDDGTRVLRNGDILRIPKSAGGSLAASTGDGLFLDLLGVDVQIGQDGLIQFGTNGDLRRVSGTQNLAQALRSRLNTPSGTYSRFPAYGNRVWDFLGTVGTTEFLALTQGLVRESLLTDPRVGAVRDVTVTVAGSLLGIDAQVEILQTSTTIRPDNLVINVGG